MMRVKYSAAAAVICYLSLTAVVFLSNASARSSCARVEFVAPASGNLVVDAGGVTQASLGTTDGQTVLNLNLTPSAAIKVQTYTSAHVGEEMSMLVDGKVFKSVKVRDGITGQGITIGPVDRHAGEALASQINGCPKG